MIKNYSSLPQPDLSNSFKFHNKFIIDEMNYDKEQMEKLHHSLLQSITIEQLHVYNRIMTTVNLDVRNFFFLYGYGGTRKTYLWKILSAIIRAKEMIALNVASSGIASLLLPRGKTAHSTFCIPLVINDESTCNINQGSLRAKLLMETKLIIWDEAPMMNKLCFQAFDRRLRDIMRARNEDNADKPFGGKVVVLGGDFRQILPVVRKGSRYDIVNSSINYFDLWQYCTVLKLSQNMRLKSVVSNESAIDIKEFADWILKIRDRNMNLKDSGEANISIPTDLLIQESETPLLSLVKFFYGCLIENIMTPGFFDDDVILCPTIDSVEQVNDFILSLIPSEEQIYLSSDTPCQSDDDQEIQGEWFTQEILNDIKCSGIPNHRIKLKVGVPIMLLRNIDQANGFCNGTRLQVNDLGKNVISTTVITGKNVGDKIFIPRMNLTPSDSSIPFKFQRRQFPISLCFAMTINKSQGQTLSKVGLYLPRPVFTHGQLYVAISRVITKKGLKILILDEDGKVRNTTTNVVYKEIFENL